MINESVSSEVKGYDTETYTVNDTIVVKGLSSNDTSLVPKTTVKDGVTLSLVDVKWDIDSSENVDYNAVPNSYSGVASYSGTYTREIPTGYIVSAEYGGEVTNRRIEKVIYTITYIGEKIQEPILNTEIVNGNSNSNSLRIACLVTGVILIFGALAAFFIFYFNTYIYLKKGDEYQLIGRRRIK